MIEWFKTLFNMVSDYIWLCKRIESVENDLVYLQNELRHRTEVHLDIHHISKFPTSVIVIGRYRNRDYVKTFNFTHEGMGELLHIMRSLERQYGHIKYVDCPPLFDATIEKYTKEY